MLIFISVIVDLLLSLYAGFSILLLTGYPENLLNEYTQRYKLTQNQTTLSKNLKCAKNKLSNQPPLNTLRGKPMLPSVKTLLGSIVDYAGVFPPAQLILQRAMANYVDYQSTPYSWMLNRFVLPVSQLEEFETLLPTFHLKQWELSLIFSGNWKSEIETVQLLSSKNQITVTALEFPLLPPTEIERLIPYLPSGVEAFFEIPLNDDPKTYLEVLKHTGTGAKIRTGGMTAEAFPSITQLYQYILSFANAQVPFKATAGLHHLLPGNYCLTYESDSLSTLMHGFLNVTVLGALAYWHKVTPQTSQEVLHESTTKNFQFTPDTISWRNHRLNIAEIKEARQRFFRSFGSCSFQEPVDNFKIFLSTYTVSLKD